MSGREEIGAFTKRVFGRYKDKVGIYGTRIEKASALGMVLCKKGRLEGERRLVDMLCLELYVKLCVTEGCDLFPCKGFKIDTLLLQVIHACKVHRLMSLLE